MLLHYVALYNFYVFAKFRPFCGWLSCECSYIKTAMFFRCMSVKGPFEFVVSEVSFGIDLSDVKLAKSPKLCQTSTASNLSLKFENSQHFTTCSCFRLVLSIACTFTCCLPELSDKTSSTWLNWSWFHVSQRCPDGLQTLPRSSKGEGDVRIPDKRGYSAIISIITSRTKSRKTTSKPSANRTESLCVEKAKSSGMILTYRFH